MARRERQLDELRFLCRSGAVARAVDLAFEHFAHYGRDEDIVETLADTIAGTDVPPAVCRRFVELLATQHPGGR